MRPRRKFIALALELGSCMLLGAAPIVALACSNPPDPGELFREAQRGLLPPTTAFFVDTDMNGKVDRAVVRVNAAYHQDSDASATVTINGQSDTEDQEVGDEVIHLVVDIPEDEELSGELKYTTSEGHKYCKKLSDLTP